MQPVRIFNDTSCPYTFFTVAVSLGNRCPNDHREEATAHADAYRERNAVEKSRMFD
jgi:hypothetical protein